jgi:hypothetical protein
MYLKIVFRKSIDTLAANAYKIYQCLPAQLFFLVVFDPEDEGHIILQIADNRLPNNMT